MKSDVNKPKGNITMCKNINLKHFMHSAIQSFKSGINHAIFALAFLITWCYTSRYYTSQGFDLPVYIQQCIMFISGIVLLAGLTRHDNRLSKLIIFAVITVLLSLFAIFGMKLVNNFSNYFYLITDFFSIFMLLQQLKLMLCFACQSREAGKENDQ